MMASPSQRQGPQHGGESSEMGMTGVEGVTDGAPLSTSSSNTTTTSSPMYSGPSTMLEGNGTTSSHQQHFNIDTFDFGADFSLPTSLDELSIFHNQHPGSTGPNSTGARSIGGAPSSDGITDSPSAVNFSPKFAVREQQHLNSQGGSRTQSPHPLSMNSNEGSLGRGRGSSGVDGGGINNSDLHNLLMAVQNSSLPSHQLHPQAHHRQQSGSTSSSMENSALSLSDMEKYLMEKEQSERMQNMQIAFLRQQFESLQRQQQANSSGEASQQTPTDLNAHQLLQQLQQFTAQQNASTPTPQNHRFGSFTQQGYHDSINTSAAAYPSQPQPKMNPSAVSQYGLITPLSSAPFAPSHQSAQSFVSPIHMPSSSQGGLMDGPRAYDANLVNGTFSPLESPAITPASVFSNVGSSNTTSQDMFSPLTSPALRPHVGSVNEEMMLPPSSSPYHGSATMARGKGKSKGKASPHCGPQGKKTTTPSASPVALPTKSVPRKNRSTTAEARANRARPSPLVKPVTASATTRKRTESLNGLPSPLGVSVMNGANSIKKNGQTDSSSTQSSAFPPLSAGAGSAKPMDASPSEGASSTPSPIDLNSSNQMPPPNGKPMTPSSIMGIQPSAKAGPHAAKSTNGQKSKAGSEGGKQVSFAPQQHSTSGNGDSPTSLQSILPGGFPAADRDAWLSMKSGGGLESRRTSHKAAEQKRRDSLKYCFDELRGMLPAITLDDDAPGGSSLGPDGLLEDQDEEEFSIEEVGDAEGARIANRAISKVALLRHSNEYLIRLKNRLARRDEALDYSRKQILELQSRLGFHSEQSPQPGLLASQSQGHAPMNVEYDSHLGSNPSHHMDVS